MPVSLSQYLNIAEPFSVFSKSDFFDDDDPPLEWPVLPFLIDYGASADVEFEDPTIPRYVNVLLPAFIVSPYLINFLKFDQNKLISHPCFYLNNGRFKFQIG